MKKCDLFACVMLEMLLMKNVTCVKNELCILMGNVRKFEVIRKNKENRS